MSFLFNINVCRVCMQNEQSTDLCKDEDLLEKFIFTTRLVVSEKDNLPKVICANCTARLKIAHKFIKTAHESENNLKNFLAKISSEFKEVTQVNKPNKDNKTQLKKTNITEDEILALVEDDETANISPQTKVNSKVENKTEYKSENKNIKRKFLPILGNAQKKSKTILESVKPKPTTEVKKSKDIVQTEEFLNIKKEDGGYHISNDIFLIHNDEIGNDINQTENEDTEQQQHTEEEDHDNEIAEQQEEAEENHGELQNSQTDINDLEINEESQTNSQLTELTVDNYNNDEEENADEENSVDNDGYISEYEAMLTNNQVDNLQYSAEFVDENSIEEVALQENTYYLQNVEKEEVPNGDDEDGNVYDIDDDDEGDVQPETLTINEPKELPAKTSAKKQFRRFYCEQCQRDFSTKTNLNRHMQSHAGAKPFACTECDKSFTQKSSLKQHMFTHTGERPYVCEICNRGFSQCKSLVFHMRRHTGEKPFQCEYCLIQFRQKDALRIHIFKHHVITELTPDGTEIFICIICQKQFNTKSKFKTHMKSHTSNTESDHLAIIQDDQIGFRKGKNQTTEIVLLTPFETECMEANIVNVAATSASDASRAKQFQCGKCFKCFALKKSLLRHMRIHDYDSDDEQSACVECNVQFVNMEDYQEHMETQHYNCSDCPELTFKTSQDLKIHMYEHELEQQEEQE